MSTQAHGRADEKYFEMVGPTFSIPSQSSRSCFHLFELRSSSEKLAEFFFFFFLITKVNPCKSSLIITEAVCCDIFESFWKGGKTKLLQRVVCKLVSIGLYCAYAPADIVPLSGGMAHNVRITQNL